MPAMTPGSWDFPSLCRALPLGTAGPSDLILTRTTWLRRWVVTGWHGLLPIAALLGGSSASLNEARCHVVEVPVAEAEASAQRTTKR